MFENGQLICIRSEYKDFWIVADKISGFEYDKISDELTIYLIGNTEPWVFGGDKTKNLIESLERCFDA